MQSALRFICRRGCRRYSYRVTMFPAMPCPPARPMAYPCAVPKDVPPRQEQVNVCEGRMRPCATSERPKPPKEPKVPFRSMWDVSTPLTDQRNCKNLLPRLDSLYYHPKYENRRFQRTWVECPPVRHRLRKVCCLDGIAPPEVQYRVKERCPDICGMDYQRLRELCFEDELLQDPTKKCRKCYWPCCPPARCKPSCKVPREKTICTRLRAPYPSYSEKHRGNKPLRSSECRCHEIVPKCVAMKVDIHRHNIDLVPTC